MLGILREEDEHSLDLDEKTRPIKQWLHRFAQDRKEAIRVEVTQLLATGFIRKVTHPEWLANSVLAKNKNGEWTMCVNYTDLNKHSLRTPFLFRASTRLLTPRPSASSSLFLTATPGITRSPSRSRIKRRLSSSPPWVHCYNTMMFGLKNTSATYQKAMQRCLQVQIERIAEAYVDDVVVKTRSVDHFTTILAETFENL
jgi:hypothetical protein